MSSAFNDSLDTGETAEYIGLALASLASRRTRRLPPRSWKAPNGSIRYDVSDLDAYLAERKLATLR